MKIAIVGYGVEGRSNYAYYRDKEPTAQITIFDEADQLTNLPGGARAVHAADIQSDDQLYASTADEVKVVLGSGAFAIVKGFDLVLRSPGVAPCRIGQPDNHWSATREFMRKCPAPVIGVTGSKGKGTTCSFIAAILRRHFAGDEQRQVHLVGNIGVPVLDVLPSISPDDIVVYEMSSFQLWDCTQSPHIAVVTMLEPDHLNVHDDFQDYIQAKLNILQYQHDGNMAIYNNVDPELAELMHHISISTRAEDVPYPTMNGPYFDDTNFYIDNQQICPISAVKLPGRHNLLNACAAIAATWEIVGKNSETIALGLSDFTGLPHRLKFVRELNDVKFYDDSIATTPGSVVAAIKSFDQPKVLILGGQDKGGDYSQLGQIVADGSVRAIVAIGENGAKVAAQITRVADVKVVRSQSTNMAEIVQTAYDLAEPGDVVIMSPAAASFDMFKSYVDRGKQFVAAVNQLQ